MKKFVALIMAALMMAMLLSGCSSTPTVDAIQKRGELIMLTNAEFPPFEYVDGDQIKGVDVDIAQAIADELGVKLTITNMNFDAIVDYVKAGKGDIGVAGMSVTDARKKAVDFSVEYVTSTQYMIVPKDVDEASFDPNGKIIGCQQGTTGDLYYASDAEVIDAKDVKRYKSGLDAAKDLINGRVDCVIIDELPAKKICEANPELKCYDPGYEPESYAIAIQKGNSSLLNAVNSVLQKLLDEGKIEEFVVSHS